jgi:ankyrin repeat protein
MDQSLATALHGAFQADDAPAVRALLAANPAVKALVNQPIGPFDSPAIANVKSRAMLDVLLEAGADLNARSRWWAGGFGLLDLAPPDVAAYALERGATLTPHAAARLGMVEELRRMITNDPSCVHARGGDGQTPLHFAANVEIARLLLDEGAQIDARDVDHESTPAQYMTGDRHEVALHLVERGCHTDILMAAALGDMALARKWLDTEPDCIRMRVSAEFFPMINPKSGGTIYQWTLGWYVSPHRVARKFGHSEIERLLFERSPEDVKLIEACWLGDAETARTLAAAKPFVVNNLSEGQRREVAHAARNNETAVVSLMLELGWPVDACGQHQGTPLHWAAFHGNVAMAQAILRHQPPLEVRDADFNGTPLGWAIHGSENGWHAKTGDYGATVSALLNAQAARPGAIAGSAAVRQVLLSRFPEFGG